MKSLNKLSRALLFITLILGTSSCVFFPQKVNLNPQIKSTSSDIGKNSRIKVIVDDKRDDKVVIGRRGNGMSSVAPINNNQNLEELIKNKVVESLKAKNFIISEKNDKTLEIALLNLKYQSLYGFITIGSKVDVTLDVVVRDPNNSVVYKNIYRSNLEKRHFMVAPLTFTNEKNINLSFQNAINNMLDDDKLIKSLK